MAETFDLVIIGAGPGGYGAARRGAQLGLRTALVEKDGRLGGTSLLRGCTPTQALIQAAAVWHLCSRGAHKFGINVDNATFDWAAISRRKELAMAKGAQEVAMLMDQVGVTVITGTGRLDGPCRVRVDSVAGNRLLLAKKIVLATGSYAAGLAGIAPDGDRVLNSDHLLMLEAVPETLIVIGGGPVGVELATVMQTFGCQVTLVEMREHLLPREDPDCGDEVAHALKRLGARVMTGVKARDVRVGRSAVGCTARNHATGAAEELSAARLLMAVGRRPATRDLGLDSVAAVTDKRGFVQTDGYMETAESGLYAVGDIVSTPQLAHVATHEGLIAAGHAAGEKVHPIRYQRVPACIYSYPEVASVGLTEAAASEAGYLTRSGEFPFAALGKAFMLDEPDGFVKVVSDHGTGEVLGVHMVGPRVTELIGDAATAMGLSADLERWSDVIHPHPSLSEAVGEAVLAAAGRALHGA